MYPDKNTLSKILVQQNFISDADSKQAFESTNDTKSFIEYLIHHELLTYSLLGQAIAESYGLTFADLSQTRPVKSLLDAIPELEASTLRIVVVSNQEDAVNIASDQPANLDIDRIKNIFPGKAVDLYYTLPEYIDERLHAYSESLETRFTDIIAKGQRVAPEILEEILKDAVLLRTSDIHFEPLKDNAIVRYRVDGSLQMAGSLPQEQYQNILNRIKVESGMRIDEHNSPQDGSMQRQIDEISVDIRVSLIPTVRGEKIVMRLLSSYVEGLSLAEVGLEPYNQKILFEIIKKPFGMILTVGPTGSGKSTTLYSILKQLNKPGVNITTIEDPVEYKMDGVNQIPVREQSGVTFAKGLRAIVRQDPDIILVGEIRDKETAEISVNAALTGHLLLSSFHANNAATAIPRMLDMGVEPFLLSSTVQAVLAQRLVRMLCHHCKFSLPVDLAIRNINDQDVSALKSYFSPVDNVYTSKGCEACNNTGFFGRTALFEIITNSPELQQLTMQNPSGNQISEYAKKNGMASMFDDGIEKIKNGKTTIEEVLRVVEIPQNKETVYNG